MNAGADGEAPARVERMEHMGGPRLSLAVYIEGIVEGWPEVDIERWIVHDLPRQFHARSAAEQREALAERVPLTHTKWDALIAAMVEHVAWLHGHEPPAWVDEPVYRTRFLGHTFALRGMA